MESSLLVNLLLLACLAIGAANSRHVNSRKAMASNSLLDRSSNSSDSVVLCRSWEPCQFGIVKKEPFTRLHILPSWCVCGRGQQCLFHHRQPRSVVPPRQRKADSLPVHYYQCQAPASFDSSGADYLRKRF